MEKNKTAEAVLMQIATAIEGLKLSYPQLKEFKASHYEGSGELLYTYRSHPNTRVRAGWRRGFPEPGKGGVVIWIRVLGKDEITQDAFPPASIGEHQVPVYVFEGTQTRPLSPAIHELLKDLGWRTDVP